MFPSLSRLCSLLLIAATLVTSVVPAVSHCAAQDFCREKTAACCCCARAVKSSHSCCTESAEEHICRCTVDQERPAVPQEQRNSNERFEVRISICAVSDVPSLDDGQNVRRSSDAPYACLSHSTLRHLAVLCRWQT
ncbi:MAG: hypothetical protein R3C18_02545 [Planctomycetaceae bacterium]